MAVLDPLKLVIENYPEGKDELVELPNHPQKPDWGKRKVPFSRELWIEREDFQQTPHKGYFRLFPGNEVRLRFGYVDQVHRHGQRRRAVHLPRGFEIRHARRGQVQGQGQHSLGERDATRSPRPCTSTTACSRSPTRKATRTSTPTRRRPSPRSSSRR